MGGTIFHSLNNNQKMSNPTHIYIIFSLLIVLAFGIASLLHSRASRLHRSDMHLQNSYIRQIVKMLCNEEFSPITPSPDTRRHRITLIEALHIVLSHTYGADLNILHELVCRYDLDGFLLRQIRHSRGLRQTHFILLLSTTPSNKPVIPLLNRYCHSKNCEKSVAALIAILALRPSTAISAIALFPHRLRALDISRIITLLRRGILPIAYEPLLTSDNTNLRMLGLAIVRNFGIEIADKELQNIVVASSDEMVVREALHTLSVLGRPLGRAKIRIRLSTMEASYRRELCRHLTREGYSLAALRTIFSPAEIAHSATLLKSYKRNLEWHPTLNT